MNVTVLAVNVLEDTLNCERVEVIREKDCPDDASLTAREGAATESTHMNLGSMPNWTLDEYRQKFTGLMNVKRFGAMAIGGRNLVVHNHSRFERDTASRAWKQRWVVLRRQCVDTLF